MLAKGIRFGLGAGDGPPETFNQIINVVSFSLSGTTWSEEDTTNHDNAVPVKTTAVTVKDEGKISLVISPYVKGNAYHAALRQLSVTGLANNFSLRYPGNEMGTFQVEAFVTSFAFETPVAGLLKAKCDLKVNGALLDAAGKLLSVVVSDVNKPTYVTDEYMEFTATFDEIVKVTGAPRLAVTLTSGTVYATYLSGNDTNILKFHYKILVGDHSETSSISVASPIDLNGGTILDLGLNAAIKTFTPASMSTYTVNHSA